MTGGEAATRATRAAEVRGLSVATDAGSEVVSDVSFSIDEGEIVGLVGETGSGKTTVGLSLLGHSRPGLQHTSGRVLVGDRSVLGLAAADLRALRGAVVAYVPQDPGASLDPSFPIGDQLGEMLAVHGVRGREERRQRIRQTLERADLPSDDGFVRRYPHQISGGQQQRVAIAMAFSCHPRLVIMDEPTTGLDVATEARILETVRALRDEHRAAILMVSHDLAMLCDVAERLLVMYAGRIVETAPVETFMKAPRHPYTLGLLDAVPDPSGAHDLVGIPGRSPTISERGASCDFAPRCRFAIAECKSRTPDLIPIGPTHEARCLRLEEIGAQLRQRPPLRAVRPAPVRPDPLVEISIGSARHGRARVLDDVKLALHAGTCLALVGESGSGKTTLARCLAGLHSDYDGRMAFRGQPLARSTRQRPRELLRSIQYVFQNPYSSLNPRRSVGELVAQPLQLFRGLARAPLRREVDASLERVGLMPEYQSRYPHELSGGERQRVALARALAAAPSVLICDEITSALDVSVQASIINLLRDLQSNGDLAMLFITHDLQLVRSVAQEVAVLQRGRVVEAGPIGGVLSNPQHPYTQSLLAASHRGLTALL
jgi:peptide/nickel transport system ATP-binding protein